MPFREEAYSQADIGNQLTRAITAIGKNDLQVAMWALVDSLSMILTVQPELGKLRTWIAVCDVPLRSGIESGTFRKSSINQEVTSATLAIGRMDYEVASRKIVLAIRMLQWVAGTKNKVLLVTTTPAAQVVKRRERRN
jgi:hypothetical protein